MRDFVTEVSYSEPGRYQRPFHVDLYAPLLKKPAPSSWPPIGSGGYQCVWSTNYHWINFMPLLENLFNFTAANVFFDTAGASLWNLGFEENILIRSWHHSYKPFLPMLERHKSRVFNSKLCAYDIEQTFIRPSWKKNIRCRIDIVSP